MANAGEGRKRSRSRARTIYIFERVYAAARRADAFIRPSGASRANTLARGRERPG
jgi:hypothetical protein